MSDQRNNQYFQKTSSNHLFTIDNRTLRHNETSKKKGVKYEGIEEVMVSEKGIFELECKKQIKHFINCLNHQNSLNPPLGWLFVAMKIFTCEENQLRQKVRSICSLSNNHLQPPSTYHQSHCIVNIPLPMHNNVILVLSYQVLSQKRQQITFDIQLISMDGNIIYKKISLRNWQDIYNEVEKIKNSYCKIFLFIRNKQQLINLLCQQHQLCNYIQSFHDMQTLQTETHFCPISKCDKQQIITLKRLNQIIEKYQFIKEWLIKRINKQYIDLNANQLFAITLTYNIINKLNITNHQLMEMQLQPHKQIIIHLLTKEYQKYKNREKNEKTNQCHYPGNLINAQSCRVCGRRVYVCCPTCKNVYKKQVALCLQCYGPYHQQLNKPKIYQQNKLKGWQEMNCQVQYLLGNNIAIKEQVKRQF